MGWAVLGAYLAGLGGTNLLVTLRDPGLAQERANPPGDPKKWDRILTQLANLAMLLMLPVAGLERRNAWSPRLPWAVELAPLVGMDNTCVMAYGFEIGQPLPGYCATGLETLPAGSLPPDDLVYTAGGKGVTLILSGASQGATDGVKLVGSSGRHQGRNV